MFRRSLLLASIACALAAAACAGPSGGSDTPADPGTAVDPGTGAAPGTGTSPDPGVTPGTGTAPGTGSDPTAGQDPGTAPGTDPGTGVPAPTPSTSSRIKHVFVIAMENHDASEVFGSSSAPYLNGTLAPQGARSSAYQDDLPGLPSEPHYVWMEAGTNAFDDRTFTNDSDASASNSTANTAHLVTQIRDAGNGVTWMSYQEGLDSSTGACPISSSGFYAAKHDPFVFFQDVAGNPPSKSNAYCAQHHKPMTALADDLASGNVPNYAFITPNLCNDMHGASGCPDSNTIRSGDTWLQQNVPALLAYANAHQGVVMIVWDEPDKTGTTPFLLLGAGVKAGYQGNVKISHSSLLKSEEQIFGLPVLPAVGGANDFSDFFESGMYP